MKKYNNSLQSENETPLSNNAKQLSSSLTKMYTVFGLVVMLVLGICVGRMVNDANNKPVEVDPSNVDAVFTEIVNDVPYELNIGESFGFTCSEENASKNIKIEYILNDVTSNTAMFSKITESSEVCSFVPSDYFTGTHVVSVTQNAYSTDDLVGSKVLASRTTEIIITVIQPDSVETPVENVEDDTSVDNTSTDESETVEQEDLSDETNDTNELEESSEESLDVDIEN